jgi:hypothetical protein
VGRKLGAVPYPQLNSPDQVAHQIAILFTASGRFLVCRLCHQSFAFASDTTFKAASLQFESVACQPMHAFLSVKK